MPTSLNLDDVSFRGFMAFYEATSTARSDALIHDLDEVVRQLEDLGSVEAKAEELIGSGRRSEKTTEPLAALRSALRAEKQSRRAAQQQLAALRRQTATLQRHLEDLRHQTAELAECLVTIRRTSAESRAARLTAASRRLGPDDRSSVAKVSERAS